MNAASVEDLERMAAALILFGKDARPLLREADKLRPDRAVKPRPDGVPAPGTPRGEVRAIHVESHIARCEYVDGCEWCDRALHERVS